EPLEDGIIRLKDGSLMASYRYKGQGLNGASQAQRSQLSKQLNEFFMDYGAGFGFYFSTIRRPASGYPEETHFPDPLTEGIDENRRQRHNQACQRYRSEKYLPLIWNRDNRAEGWDSTDNVA